MVLQMVSKRLQHDKIWWLFPATTILFTDPRFPIDGAIELHFSPGPESRHPGPAPTPAVPVTMNDDRITRADSPFEGDESEEDEDTDSGIVSVIMYSFHVKGENCIKIASKQILWQDVQSKLLRSQQRRTGLAKKVLCLGYF